MENVLEPEDDVKGAAGDPEKTTVKQMTETEWRHYVMGLNGTEHDYDH